MGKEGKIEGKVEPDFDSRFGWDRNHCLEHTLYLCAVVSISGKAVFTRARYLTRTDYQTVRVKTASAVLCRARILIPGWILCINIIQRSTQPSIPTG